MMINVQLTKAVDHLVLVVHIVQENSSLEFTRVLPKVAKYNHWDV